MGKHGSPRTGLAGAATLLACALACGTSAEQAAEDAEEESAEAIEEVVVTGTHIKGANISGVLPVAVFDSEQIELFGVGSGDELLEMMPEQGQNFFNEAENISGGVNSARGDVGAFNLRNLGTGNTLVLLNGRRMVNAAGFQTEEVGGSFVPVNTVNSNVVPTFGIDRVEILKDGASAIYGADAVAGVVNNVLESDFEGLKMQVRYGAYDHIERSPLSLNAAWGRTVNDGRTNVSVFGRFLSRERVNAQEDGRWANADLRSRATRWPWEGALAFRNSSAHSLYGQFDVVASARSTGLRNTLTDSSGEFEVYPVGDSRCQWALNDKVCGAIDGQGVIRYNLNEFRDLSAELTRYTMLAHINHQLDTMEAFTEVMYYRAETNMFRHPSYAFSSVKLRVGAANYYNPFGPCGSPNRLPAAVIPNVPCSGLQLEIDTYRYAELPRVVDVEGSVYRLLQGLRGSLGDWDWEGAVLFSKADRSDVTRNRVSNTLMVEALADPTPAAYNPFSGGVDSNLERALVDVYRDNETTLFLTDFKMSHDAVFNLPAGPAGLVAGFEYRSESFKDNRDPRLDGTIAFTDFQGDTFPFVSDVMNSSPTPDNEGDRGVTSLFVELQAPVFDSVDVQMAARYENFSDVGNTVVGKLAVGWRPMDMLLLRASWSQAFRVPNLVTVNETIVARQNTRTDFACLYAANNGGDPDQDTVDCRNSIQRTAQGSDALAAEASDNYSVGVVLEPTDRLTLTLDYWSIEKIDTVGLFGEENHTVLDLLLRLQHGTDNCAGFVGNPAVERADEVDDDVAAIYRAAGICPAGDIERVNDKYANLDTRVVEGYDVGLRYRLETEAGRFLLRYSASFLRKLSQDPGGDAATLVAAQRAGTLPGVTVSGFADLVERNGNQRQKHNFALSWRRDAFGASLSAVKIGKVYQSSLTLEENTPEERRYWLEPMTTWNTTFDYRFRFQGADMRMRLGIRNLTDERAPLADRYFGYMSDVHYDYGRNFYLDLRMSRD